jgi:hypothetical protein
MANDELPDKRTEDLELRASDTDRERVAELLRDAAGHGRISLDELEERLEAVYAARTYGELVPITRDLPGRKSMPRPEPEPEEDVQDAVPAVRPGRLVVGAQPTINRSPILGILSGPGRQGRWVVPRKMNIFSIMGGVDIDLTEATFESGTTRIRAHTFLGGVRIHAPEDLNVQVHGIGVLGGYNEGKNEGVVAPDAPVIKVSGISFLGGVEIRRVKRGRKKAEDGGRAIGG